MEDNNIQVDQQHKMSHQSVKLDMMSIISLLIKNWYWFLIGLSITLYLVRFYLGHTLPVYQTAATILINETEDRPIVDNSALLQGLGLPGGMQNIHNQIMIIKSRELIESTLESLPFGVEFYFRTIRNRLPIYPDVPLKVSSEKEIPLPKDVEFSITYIGNNMFSLESRSTSFPLQVTASFGEEIEYQGSKFSIESRSEDWLKINKDRDLCFIINSRTNLINQFSKRIDVQQMSREGSVLRISLEGTNRSKDADFLNTHIEGFLAISLDRKNAEAQRRIQFIDNQLAGITDSLLITENKLQQFRSSHRVMDLSAQGQSIIAQVTLLESERARLNLEANYYDYLADYLNKDITGEIPIVPITMGIDDPGLSRIVEELAELQGQLMIRGAGEMNPLQRNLEQRVRNSKDALRETLNGLRRANSLARSENQEQIGRLNSQASTLPITERQLLGIERKFKLNDELYTFLLETRAEQEMRRAANRSDSEVIDPADARFSTVVSPDRIKLLLVAILAGFGLPFSIIFLRLQLSKKLKYEDIRKISNIPIVGYIPNNTDKVSTVVFDNPNSSISEAFRLLRSRMQFFTKEAKSPIILITSAMPEDGKTFTAINLASVYSLLGKKTILVGFDLRKPKIFQDFNLENEKGISTWLIGNDNFKEIIQETSFENLSIISAGPVPPNPSELTALEKTEELLKLLKERYDFIIIDTSPIGVLSETFHLASLSDACLLVVRSGQTLKTMFEHTLDEISASGIKSVSLVINDYESDDKQYEYGEKYGYTSKRKRAKRRLLKRMKLK